ncbi:hypothetical protein [Roseomonas sp. USHLN139]|uniref:hypothetical protein n=1 Tax=Roseomonas sp. USHLN139 TaxID=3081298 RepID=UPI003B02E5EF
MIASDLAGAVLALAGRGGPILIPDTCSLLDILRAPIRPQFREDDVAAVARVLTLTEAAEAGATLVLTGQVRRELETNTQLVADEVERELKKTSETVHSGPGGMKLALSARQRVLDWPSRARFAEVRPLRRRLPEGSTREANEASRRERPSALPRQPRCFHSSLFRRRSPPTGEPPLRGSGLRERRADLKLLFRIWRLGHPAAAPFLTPRPRPSS